MPGSLPLNPNLTQLPVYLPGRPIEEVARELGLPPSDVIKLASNENPLGPSPKAIEAMRNVLNHLHLYPDGSAFYLKKKLATRLGVQPENLIFGNGSNEILEFVGHTVISPGCEVVVSQYAFAVYPIVTQLFGGTLVTVPAKNLGHDLEAMAKAITPNTRVVFVANPNNPTGTMNSNEEIYRFIQSVPSHVLIAFDEAYVEFLEEPPALLDWIRSGSYPNLLLMRTFSKIYGLAGLRLGYGIACPSLIQAMEKVRQPFNVNAIIQAGALAALDDDAHLRATVINNCTGIALFEQELKELGVPFVPSSTNFILLQVGDGLGIFQALQRRGIITRPMASYGLPEWIRISIGTPTENRRCLDALKSILKPEP